MRLLAALLLALAPAAAFAQALPEVPGDPRLQTIEYRPDQVVQIQGKTGYQVTVALGADERVENIALGDSAAWQVTANKRGDYLFVKPVIGGVSTNMVVVTDLRVYAFELVPAGGGVPPFSVRFTFPSLKQETTAANRIGRYKLRGDKLLRPSAMSDDGKQTIIEWPAAAALPAIYAIGADRRETLVAGNIRDGQMVIDGIAAKYIFRQDRRTASADRIAPGSR